jgi:hypothetical protein
MDAELARAIYAKFLVYIEQEEYRFLGQRRPSK